MTPGLTRLGPVLIVGTDSALEELTGQQLTVSVSLRQAPPRGRFKISIPGLDWDSKKSWLPGLALTKDFSRPVTP